MKILVIDGQGGQLGALLIKELQARITGHELMAVGTNSVATAAMLKAGAKQAATGENPVVVACRTADVIVGPIGIVIADSLLGEVTAKMAIAVGQANAVRILIPLNKCENLVAGVTNLNMAALIADAMAKLRSVFEA
jgi:hypothetical protein